MLIVCENRGGGLYLAMNNGKYQRHLLFNQPA
jgi:hypothetical protein